MQSTALLRAVEGRGLNGQEPRQQQGGAFFLHRVAARYWKVRGSGWMRWLRKRSSKKIFYPPTGCLSSIVPAIVLAIALAIVLAIAPTIAPDARKNSKASLELAQLRFQLKNGKTRKGRALEPEEVVAMQQKRGRLAKA